MDDVSTLIKHLIGSLRAKQGSVRAFGMDSVRNPVEVLRRIGYLSEERDMPEWMRMDELMRLTAVYHPNWDAAYGCELLETFALDTSSIVGKPYLGVTLSMWAVFVCTTITLAIKLSPAIPASTPVIAYLIGVTMLLVPLAATTAAPLGLAEHPHA